jgi:hypothetical protein
VMEARRSGQLGFRRLLIVQLRSSSTHARAPAPAAGVVASLVGPLLGMLNVRDGATLPRNEAAVAQFIALWNGSPGLQVQTLVFEPQPVSDPAAADADEPLSWHLTEAQKQALVRRWNHQPHLAEKLAALRDFLVSE